MPKKAINLIGKRFNMLIVIRKIARGDRRFKNQPTWLVRCDCGIEKPVTSRNLKRQKACSYSCKSNIRHGNSIEFGLRAKHLAYNQTRCSANDRGISFSLSFSNLMAITSKPCTYCGIENSKEVGSKSLRTGTYMCNGVDRIDSSKGYVLGNCVPCCTECNMAKRSRTVDEFKDWLRRAYIHSILEGAYAEA